MVRWTNQPENNTVRYRYRRYMGLQRVRAGGSGIWWVCALPGHLKRDRSWSGRHEKATWAHTCLPAHETCCWGRAAWRDLSC